METKVFTTCNGRANNLGVCDICFQPIQTTSVYCGRLIEVPQPTEVQTAEDCLFKSGFDIELFKFNHEYSAKNVFKAMELYAQLKSSEAEQRIKELEGIREELENELKEIKIKLHGILKI